VIPNLEKIHSDTNKSEFLIADKGYVSGVLKEEIMRKYKIELITPEKRTRYGTKKNNSEFNKRKLKIRYIIERTFGIAKQYARIFRRRERKIISFGSFVYMAFSNIIARKISQFIVE